MGRRRRHRSNSIRTETDDRSGNYKCVPRAHDPRKIRSVRFGTHPFRWLCLSFRRQPGRVLRDERVGGAVHVNVVERHAGGDGRHVDAGRWISSASVPVHVIPPSRRLACSCRIAVLVRWTDMIMRRCVSQEVAMDKRRRLRQLQAPAAGIGSCGCSVVQPECCCLS